MAGDQTARSEEFPDSRLLEAAKLLLSQHPEFGTLEVAMETVKRTLIITDRWNTQIDAALDQHIATGEPMTIDLAAEIISYGVMHAVHQAMHPRHQRRGLHEFGTSLFTLGRPKLVYPVQADAHPTVPRSHAPQGATGEGAKKSPKILP